MKVNRNTFMASVATLALIAGTGLASAQEHQQSGPHAAPQATQPHASQPMNNGAHPSNGARPEGANRANPGPAAQQNSKPNQPVGQSGTQSGTGASGGHGQSVNRSNKGNNEGAAAQERRIPHGLQGNASGQVQGQGHTSANVNLSAQQRDQNPPDGD
jgi:hypothetical protein